MELVIDANILFAALIKESKTRHLLLSKKWILYVPEFVLEEIYMHLDILQEKTGLSEKSLKNLLDELIIKSQIKIVSFDEFRDFFQKGEKISPDPDDAQYFALALKHRCSLWSNNKMLKKQKDVNVYTTEEILDID